MPIFNDFSGGQAPSIHRGIYGSFPAIVGLDIFSEPGALKVEQAMAKESGSTVTELVKNVVVASDGNSYWFSADSGKIWKRTSAAVWSLAHTNTGGACLGAREYKGFIYYACAATLGRQSVTNASGEASWSSQNDAYQAFGNDDTGYHPMEEVNGVLYVGDGKDLASWDNSTWTAAALDLPNQYRISALYPYGINILIGTYVGTSAAIKVNYCKLYLWDTASDSWNDSDIVYEAGINAFIPMDNQVLVQAGIAGNIYYYNGSVLLPFTRVHGTYSPTQYGLVYNQAVGLFKGISLFGFSNSPDAANTTGNPAGCGIYGVGQYDKNFPRAMSLPYPVSASSPLASVEVGCIAVIGNDLLSAWKKSTSYGVDKLSTSAKYAAAYIETLVSTGETANKTVKFFAGYRLKPASTDITFKHKINYATSWTSISGHEDDTNKKLIYKNENLFDVRALQVRVDFTVSSNSAIELDLFGAEEEG